MWHYKLVCVFLVWSQFAPVHSQWGCVEDAECAELPNSVCRAGSCGCRAGTQPAAGGAACVDVAPYHTSECIEDHQCSRLFTMFECRRQNQTDVTGECRCQPGHHYFLSSCWRSAGYGETCSRDEQCIAELRDPYALKCTGTCVCADGYYERQRGECRKIGYAIGDGCVLNEDCQFVNGDCDISSFKCYDSAALPTPATEEVTILLAVNVTAVNVKSDRSVRSHELACDVSTDCPEPFECSHFGGCVCPSGYYLSDNGLSCNAELGSRSTPEQCTGLLAEVIDGVCICPNNFFFEENMRDCIKVTRTATDSCVSDENCFTFGAAARCGPPQEPWLLRTCECDPERAVWDTDRQMCRLFAGIGEECSVDSDCLAGDLEIQCVLGACACPEGLQEFQGLCLTTGLGLGEACQASPECTATPNTACSGGRCSCSEGYQEVDDFCAAVIGGSCTVDQDCVIENTICVNHTSTDSRSTHLKSNHLSFAHLTQVSLTRLIREAESAQKTCQCQDGFVAYDDVCWAVPSGFESQCNVTRQCESSLGDNSVCVDGVCDCITGYHHRDNGCWPHTGLFEPCSRTSQCYLERLSDRTVCRNSVCQCIFEHPYNEEMHTCGDGTPRDNLTSAASYVSSTTFSIISLALIFSLLS